MPGPETAFRPPETRTRPSEDEFNIPDVTPPEYQQMDPFATTEQQAKPLHEEDLDTAVPDDASFLDPTTGEFLNVPDDVSSLGEDYTQPGEYSDGPPTPMPGSTEKLAPPKIKVVIAGLDKNIDQFAREAALRQLEEEKIRKGPLFKHLAKRVWQTLTHEYQVVKRTKAAREEIIAAQNLRLHQGGSDDPWKEATVERLGSEYGDQLTREEAGESYHKLDAENASDPETPEGKVRAGILDFLRRIARGEFVDQASFEQAFEEQVHQWRLDGISQDLIGEGRLRASNMFAMGEQVKAAVEAQEGLDAVDKEQYLKSVLENAEIVLGEAKVGSVLDMKATTSERLASKMESVLSERLLEKMRGKGFIPEKVIAGAVSLLGNEVFVAGVLSVLLVAGKKSTAFIPGLGAAVVAGFRERRALINERALAGRGEDNGEGLEGGSKRQEAIDETVYETRDASEMLAELSGLYNERGELKITTREELENAIRIQAEIAARLDLHFKGSRLVSFENADQMEDQRFDLEMALAKLETDMGKLYEDPDMAGKLGVEEGETFDKMLEKATDDAVGAIQGGMDRQDKLFNKLVLKQVLKKGLITGLTAAAMGESIKALGSAIHEIVDELVRSGVVGGGAPDMALAAMETPYEPGGGGDTLDGAQGDFGGHPDVLGSHVDHPTNLGDTRPTDLGQTSSGPGALGDNHGGAPTSVGDNATGPTNLGDHVDSGRPDNLGDSNGNGRPEVLGDNNTNGRPETTGDHVNGDRPTNLGDHNNSGRPETLGDHRGETLNAHTQKLSDHAKLNLPNGYHAETSGNQVTVTGPDGNSFSGELNQDGTLSQGTLNTMHEHGLDVQKSTDIVKGEPKVTHETVTSNEFAQNHHADMQKIKVVGFMDNDTRGSNLNELGDQHEVMANGDLKISAESMTSGGSFHNGEHIDMHEAARSGRLVVTVSADRDSEAHAIVLHMDKEGNLILGKNDPARALYDSHGRFHGGMEHIGVTDGKNPDGSTRIISLATVVGKNSGHFQDTVTTQPHMEVTTYTVTPNSEALNATSGVQGSHSSPRIIPIPLPLITRSKKSSSSSSTGSSGSTSASTTSSGSSGGSSTTPPPSSGPTGPLPGGPRRRFRRPGGSTTPPGAPGGSRRRPGTPGRPTPGTSGPGFGPGQTPFSTGPNNSSSNPNTGPNFGSNPNPNPTPPPPNTGTPPNNGGSGSAQTSTGGQNSGTGQPNGGTQQPGYGPGQTPFSTGPATGQNAGGQQSGGGTQGQPTNTGGTQTPPNTATPPPPNTGGTQTPPNAATPPPPNTGGTQTPPNAATPPPPNTGTPPPPPPPRTHGEAILNEINAETRDIPSEVAVEMGGLSPLERKMIIRTAHEIVSRVIKQSGERDYDWQVRLLKAFTQTASFLRANISSAPPEVQSLLNTASERLSKAQFNTSQSQPANANP